MLVRAAISTEQEWNSIFEGDRGYLPYVIQTGDIVIGMTIENCNYILNEDEVELLVNSNQWIDWSGAYDIGLGCTCVHRNAPIDGTGTFRYWLVL